MLKFEFLTQLLLDLNYLPLILKLLAHQDLEKAVELRIDRDDLRYGAPTVSTPSHLIISSDPLSFHLGSAHAPRAPRSFFSVCKRLASQGSSGGVVSTEGEGEGEGEGDGDACPPPVIRRHRAQATAATTAATETTALAPAPATATATATVTATATTTAATPAAAAPTPDGTDPSSSKTQALELDELGCPIPAKPITIFSWRNFFSNINFLRIMQKICKRKAHRNLLLVQYKSSTILKKALKVPQRELRLYTLKLFKNQVPYCGRKWRQTNMRVITAVYLCCQPELRDDWLAGSDVDADVEEALPLEQALRALTHWHNVKRYPTQMGHKVHALVEDQDFFARELERMEMVDRSIPGDESQRDGAWEGPLPMEGW